MYISKIFMVKIATTLLMFPPYKFLSIVAWILLKLGESVFNII